MSMSTSQPRKKPNSADVRPMSLLRRLIGRLIVVAGAVIFAVDASRVTAAPATERQASPRDAVAPRGLPAVAGR